jgi:hypothetical protein
MMTPVTGHQCDDTVGNSHITLLIPTTTPNLGLKSLPPLCRAPGKNLLQVKPGNLTPPSPPQVQLPLRHATRATSSGDPADSPSAPPLFEGCGHSRPLLGIRGLFHTVSSTADHNNNGRMGVLTGCRRLDSGIGLSTGGCGFDHEAGISRGGIDGSEGVSTTGQACGQVRRQQ